ncbi:hypothetical protein E2C01_037205 [Portunus trituberculatus]|uniref:Uncharacterized protein n=1 Tax=Portunus trituberculatus TaxID=210409 RepID=A0A5B7FDJ1_PORTR|nr:hypothetical protein [Portunus trituberculatus]
MGPSEKDILQTTKKSSSFSLEEKSELSAQYWWIRVEGERDGGVAPGDFFSPYVGCSVAEPRPHSLSLTSCQYFRSSRFSPLP